MSGRGRARQPCAIYSSIWLTQLAYVLYEYSVLRTRTTHCCATRHGHRSSHSAAAGPFIAKCVLSRGSSCQRRGCRVVTAQPRSRARPHLEVARTVSTERTSRWYCLSSLYISNESRGKKWYRYPVKICGCMRACLYWSCGTGRAPSRYGISTSRSDDAWDKRSFHTTPAAEVPHAKTKCQSRLCRQIGCRWVPVYTLMSRQHEQVDTLSTCCRFCPEAGGMQT